MPQGRPLRGRHNAEVGIIVQPHPVDAADRVHRFGERIARLPQRQVAAAAGFEHQRITITGRDGRGVGFPIGSFRRLHGMAHGCNAIDDYPIDARRRVVPRVTTRFGKRSHVDKARSVWSRLTALCLA
jgi:hypothetical protein